MKTRYLFTSAILLLLLSAGLIPVTFAQTSDGEPAEIVAEIKETIPSVQVSNWTSIDITVFDSSGINWSKFKDWFSAKVLWPVIHPNWRPYLGYTSLRFEPEIISGDPNGWYLDINPSSVTETTTGFEHVITLRARTDDSAVDYSIVVGIKCTRYDLFSKPMGESYIYVPLKAAPANFIEIGEQIATTKFASPRSMVYFDVTIKNTGYYKDTFQFEIEAENGLMGLFEQQVITMESDETKQVTVGILTPEKMFDPGTPNQVKLYVRSSGNNSRTLIGNFVVMTKGVYISPLIGYALVLIIALVAISYIFIVIFKDKKDRERFGKPNKPWLIPEEKAYLEKLREKDKNKYDETMSMMRDEYTSALLWYASYKDAIKRNEHKRGTKGGVGRLVSPLKKSDSKKEQAGKEVKKTTTKVKPSKKSLKDASDSKNTEVNSQEESITSKVSIPLKNLVKKIRLPKKQENGEKVESREISTESKEVSNKDTSKELDPEEQRLLQEQEEKRRKKEEAMKRIKKAQIKQRRK